MISHEPPFEVATIALAERASARFHAGPGDDDDEVPIGDPPDDDDGEDWDDDDEDDDDEEPLQARYCDAASPFVRPRGTMAPARAPNSP